MIIIVKNDFHDCSFKKASSNVLEDIEAAARRCSSK